MFRHLIGAAVIALVALVVPAGSAAADDYTPDDQPYTVYVSSSTVTAGMAFAVLTTGPDGSVSLTVECSAVPDGLVDIAGVSAEAITVDADGATSSVTIPTAGTCTIYVTDASGVVSNVITVTVVAPSAAGVGGGGLLPVTGASGTAYLVLAGALLLAGAAALVAVHRRTRPS